MLLVESIDKVVAWLNENVCSQIQLKLPDDYKNDKEYAVEYVQPAAFPLYTPGKDRLPPNVRAPIPSVCVQLTEGNDDLLKRHRRLQLRLCLACWNPGEHGGEVLHPRKNEAALGGYSYYRLTGEAAQTYTRNMEGWRDSFNFADLVLREIESAEYIAGHRLVKEQGIKFGLFTEEGNIWDYYPYWHNWITFTLEAGVTAATPKSYENLL
jgi:hypothetical protein